MINAEIVWWSLSDDNRVKFEMAIDSLIAFYAGNRYKLRLFVRYAKLQATDPIHLAILWCLSQKIED